jgi:hypothetical protein
MYTPKFAARGGLRLRFSGAALLILLLFCPRAVHAANPTLETILSEVQRRDAEREAAIRDMVYTAETRVLEFQDESRQEVKSETLARRRVYMRAPDMVHNEHLSMTIDGRQLSPKEMERELAKQRRGGRGDQNQEFQSPFSAEAAPLYDFELLGARNFDGNPVWAVAFRPKEAGENRFTGTAYLSQADYQPLYVEMAPAELPSILQEFAMSIRFAPVQDYQLPSVFSMDMRVRVSFLITLSDRTLSIEERYSQYRLNVGLDEEIFSGQ